MLNTNPLIGHKKAQENIIQMLSENKLPHAILLHGPKGIGKSKFAQTLALMIICGTDKLVQKNKFSYDIESGNYKRIEAGSLKEFCLIAPFEGKKQITIEQIRESINDLALTSETQRVIIIDTADDLNKNSANAILKTLEEPPKNTLLILISSSPAKLLPTINSRCRKIKLEPLSLNHVELVLNQENIISRDLHKALQFCTGSVSKAIQFLNLGNSILDKLDDFFKIENPAAFDVITVAEQLSNAKLDEALIYDQIKDIINASCKKSLGISTELENIDSVKILAEKYSYQKLSEIYDTVVETQEGRNVINLTQSACLENIFSKFV